MTRDSPLILVIDREKRLSQKLVSASRGRGWHVIAVADETEAVERARRGDVDVAIIGPARGETERVDLVGAVTRADRSVDVIVAAPRVSLQMEIEILRAGLRCQATEAEDGDAVADLVERTLERRAVFEQHRGVLEDVEHSTERARSWLGQLALLYETARHMQSTVALDGLLHLILGCVTAGDVFGFNRAVLLLVNADRKVLEGRLGVGPASAEEAQQIRREMTRAPGTFGAPPLPWDESGDRGYLDALARTIRACAASGL